MKHLAWAPPLLLTAALALGGRTPATTAGDLLIAFSLYLPLTLAGSVALGTLGGPRRVARHLAALPAAAGLLFYLRCQTDLVHIASKPVAAGSLLMLLWAASVLTPLPRFRHRLRGAGLAVACAGAFVVLVLGVDRWATGWRWHLYAEQRFLGTLATALRGDLPDPAPEAGLRRSGLDHRPGPAAPNPEPPAPEAPGPPIAFVLVDTLRADALAAYGGKDRDMARLDRFAASGQLFLDVLADAPWTRPSVASLFTGALPEQLGVLDGGTLLPQEALTLPEHLRELGYRTTAFANNPHVSERSGFNQGFDRFEHLRGRDGYARAERVVRSVARWLESAPPEPRPDFLYIHLMDPHTPYRSGPGRPPRFRQFDRDSYRAELRYLDVHLDRLLALLQERLGPEAVLFVVSDHGEELGEHGRFGHGHSLYPELTRVPAVLRVPGAPPAEIDRPLAGRDFFDLLSRIGRGEAPDAVAWAEERQRRVRYMSSYKTPRSPWMRTLFPFETIRIRGMVDGDQLTVWNRFGSTWEVYDLLQDPRAHRNLLFEGGDPESPDDLERRLREAMGFWTEPQRSPAGADRETLEALGYF
ncbi:MAG: sulfatase [Thermoanaerobaculia bacterium]